MKYIRLINFTFQRHIKRTWYFWGVKWLYSFWHKRLDVWINCGLRHTGPSTRRVRIHSARRGPFVKRFEFKITFQVHTITTYYNNTSVLWSAQKNWSIDLDFERISKFSSMNTLTLTRPIGLPLHTPVAQKIADERWLIYNSSKNRYFFI